RGPGGRVVEAPAERRAAGDGGEARAIGAVRRRRGNMHRKGFFALGLAALALAAVGCGNSGGGGGGGGASAPGVTSMTVKIGSHQPLTGPAAPGYSEIAPAAA